MADLAQVGTRQQKPPDTCASAPRAVVIWLQVLTLLWMLVELGVAVYAAVTARSPAMLAFGSDSLVELLSATVVLLQWAPGFSVSEQRVARAAGALLFALAFVMTGVAVASMILHWRPETSRAGIGITIAALIAMPILASLKRREAARSGNAALAADAVQSATCAYIALVTLTGLALNAAFHIAWFDSLAALAAIPFLLIEGRSAWRGHVCQSC
jgi:divalent metal cation (Fe/Co/Zn/Cd) transporter